MPALALPTRQGNAELWIDPDVQEVIDQMHYGSPALGWEGDERLGLYRAPGNRWEVHRMEEDGRMVVVMRSKPGAALAGLIPHLVAHDMRRARNPFVLASFLSEEDKKQHARNLQDQQELQEVLERVYHAAGRDGL